MIREKTQQKIQQEMIIREHNQEKKSMATR
jgi:hypothetical protein